MTVSKYLSTGKPACLGIFCLSENAIVMALDAERMPGRPPGRLVQRFDPAHGEERRRRYYLFRLSAPSGRTHNRYNNEDGLQCRRSLAAWWRIKDVRENLRRVRGVGQACMGRPGQIP